MENEHFVPSVGQNFGLLSQNFDLLTKTPVKMSQTSSKVEVLRLKLQNFDL